MRTLGKCYGDLPFHYSRAEELTIVFETDPDLLRSLLPEVLVPSKRGLVIFRVVRHKLSPFGPYCGAYLIAPALFGEERVVHLLSGIKNDFGGTVAGREMWGMPLQLGEVELGWRDGCRTVTVAKGGIPCAHAALALGQRAEVPAQHGSRSTLASRRMNFSTGLMENSLVALQGQTDLTDAECWSATATLQLIGGTPGDDWSLLPLIRMVNARFIAGGRDTLEAGVSLHTW